jgi:3-oxoadipate enol-lactonase
MTPSVETLSGGSVQVWGESVWYEAAGVAEENPTLLFLHESGGCGMTWYGQLVGLAQKVRCLVVDLPGHGRSEGVGHASVGEYRQAMLAFLDTLAIRWPVVLAGVDLGAAIAADMARHAPTRVAGLVLAGPMEGGRACERIRSRTSLGEAPEAYVDRLFGSHVPAKVRSDRYRRWQVTSPVVRHGDLLAVKQYSLVQTLRQISHPVLLVAGEEDRLAPPEDVLDLAQRLPRAKTVTVPRAGCLAMVEQPGLFNQAVTSFIATLPGTRPMGALQRKPGGYRRRG